MQSFFTFYIVSADFRIAENVANKKTSIRRRNEINDTSARRQPTHKTKSEDKSQLLLTIYVFRGLIDVLFANIFILFSAIKKSDARLRFASLSIRT